MRNKYEKNIESLNQQLREELELYKSKATVLKNEIKKNMKVYDAHVGIINSLRHELRIEISKLYSFLTGLGNAGKSISVFNFLAEDLSISDGGDLIDINFDDFQKPDRNKLPLLSDLPILGDGIDFFRYRSQDKDAYLEMVQEFEKKQLDFKNNLNALLEHRDLYITAYKIADQYRCILAIVKDAIDMTIIPELSGIEAFLNAVSIKESIISNNDPRLTTPAKIDEFAGTLFDCHYIFVRNCMDYYKLIVDFFTKTVLTDIIKDNKITASENQYFENSVKQIEESTKNIKNLAKFGDA